MKWSRGSLAELQMAAVVLAALPLAWLVPNHYLPWLSAWQDGFALYILLIAAVMQRQALRLPLPWALAVGVALLSITLQAFSGVIIFAGDAWMAFLYVAAFALAIGLGTTLPDDTKPGQFGALEALAFGIAAAAIGSVGVALMQWTGQYLFGVYIADLPPGARPFGNVAQANHLCTLAFMGLCSLGLLRETGRLGAPAYWVGTAFAAFGMAMSVSRTGWLQMAVLVVLVGVMPRRFGARLRLKHALALLALLGAATAAWPLLNDALLLTGGRGAIQQIDGGARGPLWWSLLDAVMRHPFVGYGWQQAVLAQQFVALDHPATLRHFDHSHNVVLDLLLWTGVPVGGLIVGAITWALWRQLRAVQDPRATWLMAAVGGVVVHALLEFPHEYAYFLLPAGVALGAAHALSPAGRVWHAPVLATRAVGATLLLLMLAVTAEYLQAEQGYRLLRLESARIGVAGITTPPPELRLLTHLSAFQRFAQTEARAGMTPAELASMREVSSRFPYPPAMFRYALALGLNGRGAEALLLLERLCRMHPRERCEEGREAWQAARAQFPELAAAAAADTAAAPAAAASRPAR